MVALLLKMVGCILVLFSSSYIGFSLSNRFSQRPLQIKALQSMLQMFETDVCYLSSNISESFSKIARTNNGPVAEVFKKASVYMSKGKGYGGYEAWEKAIIECWNNTALNKEDKEVVLSFGISLGNSDIDGQLKNIRFLNTQLCLQHEKAEQERQKNEKLFKNLGVLAGVAIVIVLL